MFKVNNKNTRNNVGEVVMVFLFCNFEHILQYFGVFQLLTLNKCLATSQAENDGEKQVDKITQNL